MGEPRSRTADDVLQPIDDQRRYAMGQQTIPTHTDEGLALQVQTGQHYQQTDRDEGPTIPELFTHITERLEGGLIVRAEKPQDGNIHLQKSGERPRQCEQRKRHRRYGRPNRWWLERRHGRFNSPFTRFGHGTQSARNTLNSPRLTQPGRTMILLPAAMRNKLPAETLDYPVLLERYGYILLANQSLIHVPEQAEQPPVRIPGH